MSGRVVNRIREFRAQRADMTQADLAQSCDVTRQTIIALEAGKYSPSLELAFKLARALGRKLEEVFQYEENKVTRANWITSLWLEICVLNDRVRPLYSDSMISDTLAIVSWRSRPRSFVALMSLYESNYLRLASLAGDLRRLPDARVSRVPDDCDLRLSVTERSPYTTSFDLTYLFPEAEGVVTYPDMRVRVYHDARLVEAQEWATRHDHQALKALRGMAERELDQRWARNTMLNKWLEYCIDRGHGFRD